MKKIKTLIAILSTALITSCSNTVEKNKEITVLLTTGAHPYIDFQININDIALIRADGSSENILQNSQSLTISSKGSSHFLARENIPKGDYAYIAIQLDLTDSKFRQIISIEETEETSRALTPTNANLLFFVTINKPISVNNNSQEINLFLDVEQTINLNNNENITIQPALILLSDRNPTSPQKASATPIIESHEQLTQIDGTIIQIDKANQAIRVSHQQQETIFSVNDLPLQRSNDQTAVTIDELVISQNVQITDDAIIVKPVSIVAQVNQVIDRDNLLFSSEVWSLNNLPINESMKTKPSFTRIQLISHDLLSSINLSASDLATNGVVMLEGFIKNNQQMDIIALSVIDTFNSKLSIDLSGKSYTLNYEQTDNQTHWFISDSEDAITGFLRLMAPPLVLDYDISSIILEETTQIIITYPKETDSQAISTDSLAMQALPAYLEEKIEAGYAINQLMAEGLFLNNALTASNLSMSLSKRAPGTQITIEEENGDENGESIKESEKLNVGAILGFAAIGFGAISALWAIYDFISRQTSKDADTSDDTQKVASEKNMTSQQESELGKAQEHIRQLKIEYQETEKVKLQQLESLKAKTKIPEQGIAALDAVKNPKNVDYIAKIKTNLGFYTNLAHWIELAEIPKLPESKRIAATNSLIDFLSDKNVYNTHAFFDSIMDIPNELQREIFIAENIESTKEKYVKFTGQVNSARNQYENFEIIFNTEKTRVGQDLKNFNLQESLVQEKYKILIIQDNVNRMIDTNNRYPITPDIFTEKTKSHIRNRFKK